jgi:S-layer homology domain.
MKKVVVLTLIFVMIFSSTAMAKGKFTDMEGHWAKDTVEKMVEMGIANGVSDTKFDPEGSVTRAEFTALMVRAMDYEAVPYVGQSKDAAVSDLHTKNVPTMEDGGKTEGYEGMFNPNYSITHEEAVKLLVTVYEIVIGPMDPGALATIFDDYFEISKWARPYINKGVMIGVAQGFENQLEFKPLQKTTRAEAVVMIHNLMNAVKVSEKFEKAK